MLRCEIIAYDYVEISTKFMGNKTSLVLNIFLSIIPIRIIKWGYQICVEIKKWLYFLALEKYVFSVKICLLRKCRFAIDK